MSRNNIILSNLTIEHVTTNIIYAIQDNDTRLPSFIASQTTSLNSETVDLMRVRMIDVLGKTGKSIELEVDETLNANTITLMNNIIEDNSKLLQITPELINSLSNSQKTKLIKDSIILIMCGNYGISNDNKYCCIIKAETDSIFSIDMEQSNNIKVQLIKDAFLGKEQKLYKIAFISHNSMETNIFVFDKNIERSTLQGAALYFYKDFLGCKIKSDNSLHTVEFFKLTQNYINQYCNGDYNLHMHLSSYLRQKGVNVIDVNDFASNCFTTPKQIDNYLKYLKDFNFPSHLIVKDMNKAIELTKKKKIVFDNGIVVQIPYAVYDQNVIQYEEHQDGVYKFIINGKILSQK